MHQKAVTVQQRHETGRTAGPLSARSSGVPKPASASFTVHHRFNAVAVYPQDTKDSLCPLPAPRSCPFGGACHACPIRIHASLKAGRSESFGEREARRIADDVMNRSDAFEKMPLDGGQQNRPHRKAGDSGSEGLAVSPAPKPKFIRWERDGRCRMPCGPSSNRASDTTSVSCASTRTNRQSGRQTPSAPEPSASAATLYSATEPFRPRAARAKRCSRMKSPMPWRTARHRQRPFSARIPAIPGRRWMTPEHSGSSTKPWLFPATT